MKTFLILGSLVFLALLSACGSNEPGASQPNIILISIDTLRADHLGCYGNDRWGESPSPTLDRLASQGVLFERCYAPRGQTHPSIASMLTGKFPVAHFLRENGFWLDERQTSFIQRLKMRGYETAGFAANLCKEQDPFSKQSAPNWWTRGLDQFGDGYAGKFKEETLLSPIEDQWTWDERTEKQARQWIDSFDTGRDKPYFLWTHFYDPHKGYLPHPSCPDYYPDYEGPLQPMVVEENGIPVDMVSKAIKEATQGQKPMREEDHKKVLALYDASIYGVDQRLDRLLAALDNKGMLENTYIVFTADHGDEMGDHNFYYYHGASIYNATLQIPLIIVGPAAGQGIRTQGLAQIVDVAPTILDLAGITPPSGPGFGGHSLVDVVTGKNPESDRKFVIAEWQESIYAYSDGQFKYILNPDGIEPRKPPLVKTPFGFKIEEEELYNLETDPKEQLNILAENKEIARELRKKLLRWLNLDGHDPVGQRSQNVPGSNEAMKALGYTGTNKPKVKRKRK